MNNIPCGDRSKPRLSTASCKTLASCANPSHLDSIYKKLPKKSTVARTLCKMVPCLFQYALRHSLDGVHGTCVPFVAST